MIDENKYNIKNILTNNLIIMKDVFITSTLKSEWNREFNPKLCNKLEEKWVTCHLPQRDTKQNGSEMDKFEQNISAVKDAKKSLVIGINESINLWFEAGFTFGYGKKMILLTTTDRQIPTMSLWMYEKVLRVDDLDNIDEYIDELVNDVLK